MSEQLLNIGPLRIGAAAQRLTLRALSLVRASTEAAEPALRAEGLEVERLELSLGLRDDKTQLTLDGVALEGLRANGPLALGLNAAAGVSLELLELARVEARQLELSVASASLAARATALRLSGVVVREARVGASLSAQLYAAELEADVALDIGALALRGHLTLQGVELALHERGLELHAARAEARGLGLDSPTVTLRAEAVALPEGLRLHAGGQLEAPVLTSEHAQLELTFTASTSASTPAPAPAPAPASEHTEHAEHTEQAEARARRAAQLEALDALLGDLDIECDVDATLPIVGRRRARHHFVLPIIDGSIEYGALERGLSALESAALDFELVGDQLVLEKDVIPLVTFDNETLLSFKLDATGQALARAGRVRLRTLATPEVHVDLGAGAGDSAAPPPLQLHSLDVNVREVMLEHEGTARLPLGPLSIALGDGDRRKGVRALRVSGSLSHRREGEAPEGALDVSCEEIVGAIHHLDVGSRLLSASAVQISGIHHSRVSLAGLRPRKIRLEAALRAHLIRLR
ncbi:MAG: hypothetical protein KC503_14910 [Myxococcales bacterium]|nr:hypothetical protein [Myxococcales bacterium]